MIFGTYLNRHSDLHLAASGCTWPHTRLADKITKVRHFRRSQALTCVSGKWAGGTRTHDRRIMSPACHHPASGCLTCTDTAAHTIAQVDFGTHWA